MYRTITPPTHAEQLKVFFDHAIDGMITIDENGIIQLYNPACEKIFGYHYKEAVGKNLSFLMPQPDSGRHDQYIKNYKHTGQAKIIGIGREVYAKHKDGHVFPIDLSISETFVNKQRLFHGIVRDLTSRKETEKHLKEALDFQSLILRTHPDIVFVKNEKFEIISANDAFLSMYPEAVHDQIIGSTTLEMYDPDERDAFLEQDRLAFKEGQAEAIETIEFPNGESRTLSTTKIRFEDSDGTPFILGIGRDITEREKMIEKLTSSNEDLERFAFICSHDLQEPLRMIRSFSEKLEIHFQDIVQNDEKAQRYLNFVTDGAARAQELIADILAYSAVGHDTNLSEKIDLNQMINSIKQQHILRLEKDEIAITSDNLPAITGNRTQIYQLLNNLINNGLKYQKSGTKPHVHIGVKEDKKSWIFHVKDNGIGIEEHHQSKVFDIFQRLHRRQEYTGNGIGLAICKKVVLQHGGKIWLESKKDNGSIFYFTFLK